MHFAYIPFFIYESDVNIRYRLRARQRPRHLARLALWVGVLPLVGVPARGRYNAWFAAAAASLQLRRSSFGWSDAAMRRLWPQ